MFKSGSRWRSEKNKIGAVFRLQFHATGVAQVGWDSLEISLIPADVGKPTVRTEKAKIREGSCYWEVPVHESLKLFREQRTGNFHEKIYYFVVSHGLSKTGFVGEVSIDFASYAESFKASYVSLPLKNAKCDAVLHVSIQRVQEDVDKRETEEIGNANNESNDRSLRAHLRHSDAADCLKDEPTCTPNSPLYDEIPVTPDSRMNNRESLGSDLTLSSSESSYGLDTPGEFGVKDNLIHQDPTSVLTTMDPLPESTSDLSTSRGVLTTATSAAPDDVAAPNCEVFEQEPVASIIPIKIHEEQMGNSSDVVAEVLSIEKSEDASDLVIGRLKAEISTLSRKAEVSELELQTLRKQIVKESKKGQDLLREADRLKEERDALRVECQKAKARNKFEKGDPRALVEELRQEINYEKKLSTNLRVQLMKMQESNSELILAVHDLDEMLEQKDKEILNLSSNSKSDTGDEEEQNDLFSELEMCKRDKEELEGQMEQLVLDNEILKQQNHELSYQLEQSEMQEQLKLQYECSSAYATITELGNQVEIFENELKSQSSKFSESLATISKLEEHAKALEEALEKQAQGFETDLEILMNGKVELEKRAIRAEEALRKTRWQNANAAERIHGEFKRISVDMTSTLESNEKFTKKALLEANELRAQKNYLEESLEKAKEEFKSIREQYEVKLNEISDQLSIKVKQIENLEDVKSQGEKKNMILSEEMLMLKAEIETLKVENNNLSVEAEEKQSLKAELEQVNASLRRMELVLQRGEVEKNAMEKKIILLQEEADKSINELDSMRKAMDEKNTMIDRLQLELESLRTKHDEVKHSFSVNELEKESLKEKLKLLEGQIKLKETSLQNKFEELERRLEDSQIVASCLQKDSGDMSKEMALMKERNKEMECELKEMQGRFSEMSLKLAQVEGERQQLMMRVRNLKNAKKS